MPPKGWKNLTIKEAALKPLNEYLEENKEKLKAQISYSGFVEEAILEKLARIKTDDKEEAPAQ